jgi:hypothetical protein
MTIKSKFAMRVYPYLYLDGVGTFAVVGDLKSSHPFGSLTASANTATGHRANTEVTQLPRLGKHRSRYLVQGIKTHYHSIEHHHKTRPSVETLHTNAPRLFRG